MPENLENFRSTEHYGVPLEGSTIFLHRSSLGSTSIESCKLADLKAAIPAAPGRTRGATHLLSVTKTLSTERSRHNR